MYQKFTNVKKSPPPAKGSDEELLFEPQRPPPRAPEVEFEKPRPAPAPPASLKKKPVNQSQSPPLASAQNAGTPAKYADSAYAPRNENVATGPVAASAPIAGLPAQPQASSSKNDIQPTVVRRREPKKLTRKISRFLPNYNRFAPRAIRLNCTEISKRLDRVRREESTQRIKLVQMRLLQSNR